MPIPAEINNLIKHLNQELDLTEQQATEGLVIARKILNHFPNNIILVQYFAYLNNALFLVNLDKRYIQEIIETLSSTQIMKNEEIQEIGEGLASELGRVMEARIAVTEIKNRLEYLQ